MGVKDSGDSSELLSCAPLLIPFSVSVSEVMAGSVGRGCVAETCKVNHSIEETRTDYMGYKSQRTPSMNFDILQRLVPQLTISTGANFVRNLNLRCQVHRKGKLGK